MPGPENTLTFELPETAIEGAKRIMDDLGRSATGTEIMAALGEEGTGLTGAAPTVAADSTAQISAVEETEGE